MINSNQISILYPAGLDSFKNIPQNYNSTESVICTPITETSLDVSIIPDFNVGEKWSESCGYITAGDENIFYNEIEFQYKERTEIKQIKNILPESLYDVQLLPSVPNAMFNTDNITNSVTISNHNYSLIGELQIGTDIIDFCVYHDANLNARFVFSNKSLFNVKSCSYDQDTGLLSLDTNGLVWQINKVFIPLSEIDKDTGKSLKRVCKLKKFTRGIRGSKISKLNTGDKIRGYICAEAANVITDMCMNIAKTTEDCHIQIQDFLDNAYFPLADDHDCPNITYQYEKTATTQSSYDTYRFDFFVGSNIQFSVDFGDGNINVGSTTMYYNITKGQVPKVKIYSSSKKCSQLDSKNQELELPTVIVGNIPQISIDINCPVISCPPGTSPISPTPINPTPNIGGQQMVQTIVNLTQMIQTVVAGIDGLTGPPGPVGPIGPMGPPGAIGPVGPTGANGTIGVPGIVGPVGPVGPKGDDGKQGPQGPQGHQGNQGNQGNQGSQGKDGQDGQDGPQGPAGINGTNGQQGPQGIPGAGGGYEQGYGAELYIGKIVDVIPHDTEKKAYTYYVDLFDYTGVDNYNVEMNTWPINSPTLVKGQQCIVFKNNSMFYILPTNNSLIDGKVTGFQMVTKLDNQGNQVTDPITGAQVTFPVYGVQMKTPQKQTMDISAVIPFPDENKIYPVGDSIMLYWPLESYKPVILSTSDNIIYTNGVWDD